MCSEGKQFLRSQAKKGRREGPKGGALRYAFRTKSLKQEQYLLRLVGGKDRLPALKHTRNSPFAKLRLDGLQLFAGVRKDRVVSGSEGAETSFGGNTQALLGLQSELFGNLLGAIKGQALGENSFGKVSSGDDVQSEGGLCADADASRSPQGTVLVGCFYFDVGNFALWAREQAVNGVARSVASARVKIVQGIDECAVGPMVGVHRVDISLGDQFLITSEISASELINALFRVTDKKERMGLEPFGIRKGARKHLGLDRVSVLKLIDEDRLVALA